MTQTTIFNIITQNGEIYGVADGDVAVHGKKIFDLLNHELATFETVEDAEKAAGEIATAFENGEKIFSLEK